MNFAIITAGGTGLRMGSDIPKQFLEINGKAIIIHTIERFLSADPEINIIITLPKANFNLWKEIESTIDSKNISVVDGGKSRFHSVKNALNSIQSKKGIVAIHDAVRPFVPKSVILNSLASAKNFGSGVVAIELKDSLRKIENGKSKSLDRSLYRIMQTPQTFDLEGIRSAYNNSKSENHTDDASVWEASSKEVKLVEGSSHNIKVTFKEDLPIAELIYNIQKASSKPL